MQQKNFSKKPKNSRPANFLRKLFHSLPKRIDQIVNTKVIYGLIDIFNELLFIAKCCHSASSWWCSAASQIQGLGFAPELSLLTVKYFRVCSFNVCVGFISQNHASK